MDGAAPATTLPRPTTADLRLMTSGDEATDVCDSPHGRLFVGLWEAVRATLGDIVLARQSAHAVPHAQVGGRPLLPSSPSSPPPPPPLLPLLPSSLHTSPLLVRWRGGVGDVLARSLLHLGLQIVETWRLQKACKRLLRHTPGQWLARVQSSGSYNLGDVGIGGGPSVAPTPGSDTKMYVQVLDALACNTWASLHAGGRLCQCGTRLSTYFNDDCPPHAAICVCTPPQPWLP
jgi:hypothetical protein